MVGRFCEKHGGDVSIGDAYWLCDTCARDGIDRCKCGSHARYFGEAMLSSITCEAECGETLTVIGSSNTRKMWNEGRRGWVEDI